MGLPLIKHSSFFLLPMENPVCTRRGMHTSDGGKLCAAEFYSCPGMLIVTGVDNVHALHVLQLAAVISCVMSMMTKGSECALKIPSGCSPLFHVPQVLCWFSKCVCCKSFTNSSFSRASSVSLKMYYGKFTLLSLILSILYFTIVK